MYSFVRVRFRIWQRSSPFTLHCFIKRCKRKQKLFGEENDTIRKKLRNHGIKGILRKRVRTPDNNIAAASPEFVEAFFRPIGTEDVMAARTTTRTV